jgi:ATP-dependent exoDNAse (exonuclease V) alpha subunit
LIFEEATYYNSYGEKLDNEILIEKLEKIFSDEKYIEEIIVFKDGADVMITRNIDPMNGIVNGTRGTIHVPEGDKCDYYEFRLKGQKDKSYPIFRVEDFHVVPYKNVVRRQLPFVLAYGGTVHKWQGQEMKGAIIDCKNFEHPGQLYTALSR